MVILIENKDSRKKNLEKYTNKMISQDEKTEIMVKLYSWEI